MQNLERPPLRIGVFIDSMGQPRWRYKVLCDIIDCPFAEIVLIVKKKEEEQPRIWTDVLGKIWLHRRHLIYTLYRKIDDFLFKQKLDAFEPTRLEDLKLSCPVIDVSPRQTRFSDYLEDEDVRAILNAKLDVALRFGFRILRGEVLNVARYGVWSYHHGDNLVYRGSPAGFWEVMNGDPITGSILQVIDEELDNGKVLYRSYTSTYKRSVRKNCNNFYMKSSKFVIRKLQELYNEGQLLEEPQQDTYNPYSRPLYKTPTNGQMIRLLYGLVKRYATDKFQELRRREQWWIFFYIERRNPGAIPPLYRFTPIIPPRDRYWADPFPIFRDRKYYVFVEEFVYRKKRGHISVIEVDAEGNYKEAVTVLKRDYHLSHPFLFEWQDKLFMIPETKVNRTVEVFECVEFPTRWELRQVLLDDVCAVDATLFEKGGRWWMFVNIAQPDESTYDELYLYHADNPFGPWAPHKYNPVKSDVRSARPAGRVFRHGKKLLRPAQDCGNRYGYGISINEICRLDEEGYEEHEIAKILPEWRKELIGTHTLNSAGAMTMVDGVTTRRRFLG